MKCPSCENQISEIHNDRLIECHQCGFFRREGGGWTPADNASITENESPNASTPPLDVPVKSQVSVPQTPQGDPPPPEIRQVPEHGDDSGNGKRRPMVELEFFGPEIG